MDDLSVSAEVVCEEREGLPKKSLAVFLLFFNGNWRLGILNLGDSLDEYNLTNKLLRN